VKKIFLVTMLLVIAASTMEAVKRKREEIPATPPNSQAASPDPCSSSSQPPSLGEALRKYLRTEHPPENLESQPTAIKCPKCPQINSYVCVEDLLTHMRDECYTSLTYKQFDCAAIEILEPFFGPLCREIEHIATCTSFATGLESRIFFMCKHCKHAEPTYREMFEHVIEKHHR
jgi:hypothetical protein